MHLFVLIPSILIFLYSLYRLVKDDYVFIRKGMALEQTFDIAFETLWISLFVSRLSYLVMHVGSIKQLLLEFFSIYQGGFSLPGALLGGIIALYMISRSKRIPFGRLSDFFSLSLLYAMPLGFLSLSFFYHRTEMLIFFLLTIVYFLIGLFFAQFLYPKLLSRTIKEGTVAIYFILLFSVLTAGSIVGNSLHDLGKLISVDIAILILLFVLGIILLLKQGRLFASPKRSLVK